MATELSEKVYDYLAYGRLQEGKVYGDAIGFVSTKNIRSAKDGDVRSFGLPLENIQGTVGAMFPEDFDKASVPETVWLNVAMFNNDNFKLADRLTKAINDKERVRIRVTGEIHVKEYQGKKSLEMYADDFHVLWADSYKGTNIGGGTDGYSYVTGRPLEKGKAQVAIQGFVSRPELRSMSDGRKVLGFGVALNKADRTLNYALGAALPQEDTTWVDVAIFDNEGFERAERAAKVLRQGAAISGLGYASVEEYEGKERVSIALNGFQVIRYAPRDEEGESNVSASIPENDIVDDNPFDENVDFDFDDDDLPF